MDIMELGAIGELVGGVAVIGSLIYVGIQVRQSNEQSRQALDLEKGKANREVSGHFAEVFGALRDPELMGLIQRAIPSLSGLSSLDQGRVAAWIGSLHIHVVSTFLARQQRLIDEDYAQAWTDWYVSFLKSPGFQEWWTLTRPSHHPGFVQHIEERLSSPGGPAPIDSRYPWFAGLQGGH